MKKLIPLLAFVAVLLFAACATLQPGADKFVVRVEQTQLGASATLDFVLHLDNADRGYWRSNAPAFHDFCEWLRTPVPIDRATYARALAMQLNVQSLKVAYKANRNGGTSNALYLAADVLSMACSQANSWSNILTLNKH